LPGTNESSDEIYILVAHYDTWYNSPGANDGSSGVAAVLAAAKLMSQYSFEHTVRFLFVDGEKQFCLGSREYVADAKNNKDNIVAVFNVDAIGNPGPDYRGDEIVITYKKPCWVADYLKDVNKRYHNSLNFIIFNGCTGDHYCDHKTFLNNGYDVVCICEAEDDENWLKPTDTIDNIDMAYATKVTKLVIATICELALGLN
jgi:Zn-dependent M28 family amino/carboxypeptidase